MASPGPGAAPHSASPASLAARGAPTNGPPKVVRRRPNSANPLVTRQARPRSGQQSGRSPAPPRPAPTSPSLTAATTPPVEVKAKPVDNEEGWQTFQLTTTKASLLKGLRHHVMRLQAKRLVDPLNPEDFTVPIRLHRRDPAAPLQGAREQMIHNGEIGAEGVDAEEKAKLEADREKREVERAATLEKIAPYGGAAKPRQNPFKRKTQQVFNTNEAEKKLRYEEFLPWFIEDFDNKNTWQGQLESSLSHGSYAMFVLDGSNFRMVPIEKWYKFTERNKFKTLSIEEAEQAIKRNTKTPRWMMKLTRQEEKEQERLEREMNMKNIRNLRVKRGDRLEGLVPKTETADADELDFDDDRFADDEEAPVMEGDEQENKEIEKRIKKEQLSANLFELRSEKDYEKEEREKRKLEAMRHKHGKRVNKLLMNREGNFTYETDSDRNPYATSSGEEDSETERIKKEEERKKEEEAKKEQAAKEQQEKTKKPVVAVPAEPKSKPSPSKKVKSTGPTNGDTKSTSISLKRGGSADLSESGNEKSRKKPKKTPQAPTSSATTNGQQSKLVKLKVPAHRLSQFRSLTQSTVSKVGKKRKAGNAGSGGEGSGEDTAAEMSDGTGAAKKQRIKIVSGGRALSPPANSSRHSSPAPTGPSSRAGSPAATSTAAGSRAGSPDATASPAQPAIVTEAEIKAICLRGGDEGITTAEVAKAIGGSRLKNITVKNALIADLKRMTVQKGKKMFLRDEFK